jgi:hypothetical protein
MCRKVLARHRLLMMFPLDPLYGRQSGIPPRPKSAHERKSPISVRSKMASQGADISHQISAGYWRNKSKLDRISPDHHPRPQWLRQFRHLLDDLIDSSVLLHQRHGYQENVAPRRPDLIYQGAEIELHVYNPRPPASTHQPQIQDFDRQRVAIAGRDGQENIILAVSVENHRS